jgi:Protein of unknown function (DUF1579)
MTKAFACTLAAAAIMTVAPSAARAQMPPPPGPEHQVLASDAGTWDAVLEMTAPDGSTMRSNGVQEDTVGCGGRCLVTSFKSEMMPGTMFEGRGVTAWDGAKKKYVGAWTDSMSPGMGVSEGTYDAATKSFTSFMDSTDMTGTVVKTKSVVQHTDADHKVMTMFMTGPDGKEAQAMKISYTRRK